MAESNHNIGKVILQNFILNQTDWAFYEENIVKIFEREIVPELERICDYFDVPGIDIEIENIQINIQINQVSDLNFNFKKQFLWQFSEQLERQISLKKQQNEAFLNEKRLEQKRQYLHQFIESGQIPWHSQNVNLDELFFLSLEKDEEKIMLQLEKILLSENERKRFLSQFSKSAVQKLVSTLSKNATFWRIDEWVYLLTEFLNINSNKVFNQVYFHFIGLLLNQKKPAIADFWKTVIIPVLHENQMQASVFLEAIKNGKLAQALSNNLKEISAQIETESLENIHEKSISTANPTVLSDIEANQILYFFNQLSWDGNFGNISQAQLIELIKKAIVYRPLVVFNAMRALFENAQKTSLFFNVAPDFLAELLLKTYYPKTFQKIEKVIGFLEMYLPDYKINKSELKKKLFTESNDFLKALKNNEEWLEQRFFETFIDIQNLNKSQVEALKNNEKLKNHPFQELLKVKSTDEKPEETKEAESLEKPENENDILANFWKDVLMFLILEGQLPWWAEKRLKMLRSQLLNILDKDDLTIAIFNNWRKKEKDALSIFYQTFLSNKQLLNKLLNSAKLEVLQLFWPESSTIWKNGMFFYIEKLMDSLHSEIGFSVEKKWLFELLYKLSFNSINLRTKESIPAILQLFISILSLKSGIKTDKLRASILNQSLVFGNEKLLDDFEWEKLILALSGKNDLTESIKQSETKSATLIKTFFISESHIATKIFEAFQRNEIPVFANNLSIAEWQKIIASFFEKNRKALLKILAENSLVFAFSLKTFNGDEKMFFALFFTEKNGNERIEQIIQLSETLKISEKQILTFFAKKLMEGIYKRQKLNDEKTFYENAWISYLKEKQILKSRTLIDHWVEKLFLDSNFLKQFNQEFAFFIPAFYHENRNYFSAKNILLNGNQLNFENYISEKQNEFENQEIEVEKDNFQKEKTLENREEVSSDAQMGLDENEENFEWQKEQYKSNPAIIFAVLNYFLQSGFLPWWSPYDRVEELQKYFTQLIFTNYRGFLKGMNELLNNQEISNLLEEFLLSLNTESDFSQVIKTQFFQLDEQFKALQKTVEKDNLKELESYRTAIKILSTFTGKREVVGFLKPLQAKIVALWIFYWWKNKNFDFSSQNERIFFNDFADFFSAEKDVLLQQKILKLLYLLKTTALELTEKEMLIKTIVFSSFSSLYGFDTNFIAQAIVNWQRNFPNRNNFDFWEKLLQELRTQHTINLDYLPDTINQQVENVLIPILFSDDFQNQFSLQENTVLKKEFVQLLAKNVYDFSLKLGLSIDEKTIQKINKTFFWKELLALFKTIEKNNFQSFQIWFENRKEELLPEEKELFFNWPFETAFFVFVHAVLKDFSQQNSLPEKQIWNEIVYFSQPQLKFILDQENQVENNIQATERLTVWLDKTFINEGFEIEIRDNKRFKTQENEMDEIIIESKILNAFFDSPLFRTIQQIFEQLNRSFDAEIKEKITRLLLFFQKEISAEKMPIAVDSEKWMANVLLAVYWLFVEKKSPKEVEANFIQKLRYAGEEAKKILKSAQAIIGQKQTKEKPEFAEQNIEQRQLEIAKSDTKEVLTKTMFENANLKHEVEAIFRAFNLSITDELSFILFQFWEIFWLKSNRETSFFKQKPIKWQAHAIWLLLVLWYRKSNIEQVFELLKNSFSIVEIRSLKNWVFSISNQNVLIQVAPFFDSFREIESTFDKIISNELEIQKPLFYDENKGAETYEREKVIESKNQNQENLEFSEIDRSEEEKRQTIDLPKEVNWPLELEISKDIFDGLSQKVEAIFPAFRTINKTTFEQQIQWMTELVSNIEKIDLFSNSSQQFLANIYSIFTNQESIEFVESQNFELPETQKVKLNLAKAIAKTQVQTAFSFEEKIYLLVILSQLAENGAISEVVAQKIVQSKTHFSKESVDWLKAILPQKEGQKIFDSASNYDLLSAERTEIIQQTSKEKRKEILQETFEEIFTQKQYDYTLLQDWNYWLNLWETIEAEKQENQYFLQAYLNELALNELTTFSETKAELEAQTAQKIADELAKQQKAEDEGKFEATNFSMEKAALEVLQFEIKSMDEKNLNFLNDFPLPGINFLYQQTELWISKLIKTLIDKMALESVLFEKWQNIYLPTFKRIHLLELALTAFFKELLIFKTIEKKDVQQLIDAELMPKPIRLFIEKILNDVFEKQNIALPEIALDKVAEKNIFIQSSDKNRQLIAEVLSNEHAGVASIEKLKNFVNEFKKPEIKEIKKAEYEAYDWDEKAEAGEKIYINNAGLVLIWPFLSGFFKRLGLVEKGKFIDEEKREKAIHISQYLVDESSNNPEYNLLLNKLICGLEINQPLERFVKITEEEKQEANLFLEAIKNEWKQMQKTSLVGFRETFLQREGYLYKKADNWFVKVEWKSFDVLLMTVPWGYTLIRLPWNKEIIYVEWTQN